MQTKGEQSLRAYYGTDRFDNAFFVSETVSEAILEDKILFGGVKGDDENDLSASWQIESVQSQGALSANANTELVHVVISPTLVKSNDFVYVIEDFYRAKFTICGIKKRAFKKEEIAEHFKD